MIPNVILAIGVVWIYLSVLNFVQTLSLHNGIKALELDGDVYGERNGKFLKTRVYVLVAVDEDGTILNAKKLRTTRYVVPARLSQLDELRGVPIDELEEATAGRNKAIRVAAQKLVARYHSFDAQRAAQKAAANAG